MTRRLMLAALAALALSVPVSAREPADIVRTAAAAGNFRTLLNCLVAADLLDALKADGPFTVLAPTDEAFAKLPKGTLETLLKPDGKEQLKAILLYHVIPNKGRFNFESADAGTDYTYKTLNGATVTVKAADHTFTVNGAKIVTRNIACKNGSVQAIDGVLLPPKKAKANAIPAVAADAGTFKTLLELLTAAELADVLGGDGPFTVFAPTDAAFQKLGRDALRTLAKPEARGQLVKILKLHVVAGKKSAAALVADGRAATLAGEPVKVAVADGRVTINGVGLSKTDVPAANGVIHVLDRVLTPSH